MQYRIVAVLGCVAAGFVLGVAWQSSRHGASDALSTGSSAPRVGSRVVNTAREPLLIVDSAGLVTGHFDRVTPAWLLEALQAGRIATPGVQGRIEPVPAAATGEPGEKTVDPMTADEAILALRSGSEPERYAALTEALQAGVELPVQELINTFVTGLSDRLALLAFHSYVDRNSDDLESGRLAVARGLESASPAVRAEATRLMGDVERMAEASSRNTPQGSQ